MNLIKKLIDHGIVQFGNYKLKSGIDSQIYIDLRKSISFPEIHKEICQEYSKKIQDITNTNTSNKKICGTPYGAISYTSYISINDNIPMLFLRKEQKQYGTKKQIEGNFNKGDHVILIEDIVTSGHSVRWAADQLQNNGLIVKKIICFFSRNNKNLYYNDIPIEYIYNLNDLSCFIDLD